jgi:hypothetical protein
MLPICKLCKINPADKTNSHIIPRFITERLFPTRDPNPKQRQAIAVSKDSESKTQTTPKPDNIFCSDCETRFSRIETLVAPTFREIFNHQSNISKFDLHEEESHGHKIEYIEHKVIDIAQFRTFLFSIVWRTSISDDIIYKKFKLAPTTEEEVRVFLDSTLKLTHSQLVNSLKTKDTLQCAFLLTKPKNVQLSSPRMGLTAIVDENGSRIYMVECILTFVEGSDVKEYGTDSISIMLVEDCVWKNMFKRTYEHLIS